LINKNLTILQQKIFYKYNFDQKLLFTFPYASIKDAQATGDAFSPQKENIQHLNMKFIYFFYFCGSFLPSWIRIQRLKFMRMNADPDPKPRFSDSGKAWNKGMLTYPVVAT
jgi:hypothetical protein